MEDNKSTSVEEQRNWNDDIDKKCTITPTQGPSSIATHTSPAVSTVSWVSRKSRTTCDRPTAPKTPRGQIRRTLATVVAQRRGRPSPSKQEIENDTAATDASDNKGSSNWWQANDVAIWLMKKNVRLSFIGPEKCHWNHKSQRDTCFRGIFKLGYAMAPSSSKVTITQSIHATFSKLLSFQQ